MRSILTVTEGASVDRLVTLDRVKTVLGITSQTNDEELGRKIDEATSDITGRVRPSCKRETLSVTFRPDAGGEGADRLVLPRYPVGAVTAVTVDDVALATTEFEVETDTGLLYRLDTSGYPCSWAWCKSIVVAFSAGYVPPGDEDNERTLPPALEGAALELVTGYWTAKGRDPTIKSEENPGVQRTDYWVGAIGEAGELPPGVMAKIGPYCQGATG